MKEVLRVQEDIILQASEKITKTSEVAGGLLNIISPRTTALHFWSEKGKFNANVNFPVYKIVVQDEEAAITKIHYVIDSRSKLVEGQTDGPLRIIAPFKQEPPVALQKMRLQTREEELNTKEESLIQKEKDLSLQEEEFLKRQERSKVMEHLSDSTFDKVSEASINQDENKQRPLYYPYIFGISCFLVGGVSAYYGHSRIESLIAGIVSLWRRN